MNAHAPRKEKDDQMKSNFYDSLERFVESPSPNDIIIKLVEREERGDKKGTTDGHNLHNASNENDQCLSDFSH